MTKTKEEAPVTKPAPVEEKPVEHRPDSASGFQNPKGK